MAVRFNKLITSVGYLTAKENEVELLTTKFYNLHIVSVKKLQNFTRVVDSTARFMIVYFALAVFEVFELTVLNC